MLWPEFLKDLLLHLVSKIEVQFVFEREFILNGSYCFFMVKNESDIQLASIITLMIYPKLFVSF